MHIPEFRLIDRIKTKTVIAGLKYLGGIGLQIIKLRLMGHSNKFDSSLNKNESKSIIDKFHILYEENHQKTYDNTFWRGHLSMKCPLDLWIYQEIIFETKPDIIIETGTNQGGTALYLANLCELFQKGEIITIDITKYENRPDHEKIHYIQGDASSKETIAKIIHLIKQIHKNSNPKIMVILDDEHSEDHVMKELKLYSELVTKDNYLIVEDTRMAGHPVWPELKSGPMEAVKKFFKENDDFIIDTSREKFLLTFNPDGFLKKIK